MCLICGRGNMRLSQLCSSWQVGRLACYCPCISLCIFARRVPFSTHSLSSPINPPTPHPLRNHRPQLTVTTTASSLSSLTGSTAPSLTPCCALTPSLVWRRRAPPRQPRMDPCLPLQQRQPRLQRLWRQWRPIFLPLPRSPRGDKASRGNGKASAETLW